MANLFHNQVIHAMNHIDKLSLREGVNMVCFTELGMYLYKIMSFFGKTNLIKSIKRKGLEKVHILLFKSVAQ